MWPVIIGGGLLVVAAYEYLIRPAAVAATTPATPAAPAAPAPGATPTVFVPGVLPGSLTFNIGDFILVDIVRGNLTAVTAAMGAQTANLFPNGSVRMQLTALDPFGDGQFVSAQFADPRLSFPNNAPIPVPKSGIVGKTV